MTDDGSPRGQVAAGAVGAAVHARTPARTAPRYAGPRRREAADLLADLVVEGVRTLAFVRSRRGAEQVALTAAELLAEVDPALADQVAAYRGGYLPEERRALERRCARGELTGLAATNALELGIDISGLDAVLMAGFPGTRAALWQQVGRAGRGAPGRPRRAGRPRRPARHLPRHPPRGAARAAGRGDGLRPGQPATCSARTCAPPPQELAADRGRPGAVRPDAPARSSTRSTEAGLLRRRPRGWFWTDRRRASRPGRHPLDRRRRRCSSSRPRPAG